MPPDVELYGGSDRASPPKRCHLEWIVPIWVVTVISLMCLQLHCLRRVWATFEPKHSRLSSTNRHDSRWFSRWTGSKELPDLSPWIPSIILATRKFEKMSNVQGTDMGRFQFHSFGKFTQKRHLYSTYWYCLVDIQIESVWLKFW